MIKRLIKLLYIAIIFAILYLPLALIIYQANFSKLFSNILLNKVIITTILICTTTSLIINIIGIMLAKYLYTNKKQFKVYMLLPMMCGVFLYVCNDLFNINEYLLLILSYFLLLLPIVIYLYSSYIEKLAKNNKDILKSFGKIDFLKLLDKKIINTYFLCFIFVYSDSVISPFIFNRNINVLGNYLKHLIQYQENYEIANAGVLSFIVVIVIVLVLYMINYESKLRRRYEKDN